MRCSSLGRPCVARQAIQPRRHALQCTSAVQNESGTSTSAPSVLGYRIRCGTKGDAPGLAYVCAESFGRGNFPGVQSESLDRLEDRYATVIEESMETKLVDALEAKEQAAREHREFRLQQYLQQLRAQLAALRGEPARFVTQLSPHDERRVQRWRRSRQFLVLVAAEETPQRELSNGTTIPASTSGPGPSTQSGAPGPHASHSQATLVATQIAASTSGAWAGEGTEGAVVGCATLSLMQPEALLPPPFPSNKPFRLYVSNMSVLPSHRRRGLARQLLQRCERVARLWGHTTLWLDVQRTNTAAAALYHSMGYRPVAAGGLRMLPGPLAQELMCKQLPPLPEGCRGGQGRGGARGSKGAGDVDVVKGVSGSNRAGDGVFVWNTEVPSGAQGDDRG